MSGTLPGTCCSSVPQAIIIFGVLLCGGEKQFEIHSQVCAASVHLGWDGNWNSRNIWAVTLMFLKQSSDNSFSWAVVTFEVAPHQERICPHRMKVVTWLYCLLLSRKSVTHVTIQHEEVDMMPFYTWGYISTTVWTELIKHIVQESFKTISSVVASTRFFVVMGKEGNSTVKEASKIATKLSGGKSSYFLIQIWHLTCTSFYH